MQYSSGIHVGRVLHMPVDVPYVIFLYYACGVRYCLDKTLNVVEETPTYTKLPCTCLRDLKVKNWSEQDSIHIG